MQWTQEIEKTKIDYVDEETKELMNLQQNNFKGILGVFYFKFSIEAIKAILNLFDTAVK